MLMVNPSLLWLPLWLGGFHRQHGKKLELMRTWPFALHVVSLMPTSIFVASISTHTALDFLGLATRKVQSQGCSLLPEGPRDRNVNALNPLIFMFFLTFSNAFDSVASGYAMFCPKLFVGEKLR